MFFQQIYVSNKWNVIKIQKAVKITSLLTYWRMNECVKRLNELSYA